MNINNDSGIVITGNINARRDVNLQVSPRQVPSNPMNAPQTGIGRQASPVVQHTVDRIRSCRQCYAINRSDARFCGRCGSAFPTEITAFIAYADRDDKLIKVMVNHLKSLEDQNLLTIRSHHDIQVGADRRTELDKYLGAAEIILLLISADLFHSEYFTKDQINYILRQYESGEAVVIPVILRAADWETTPLGRLQPLPEGGRPIQSWPDKDEAFLNVVQGIRRVIKEVYNRP
jgi:ribosomal protein L40E